MSRVLIITADSQHEASQSGVRHVLRINYLPPEQMPSHQRDFPRTQRVEIAGLEGSRLLSRRDLCSRRPCWRVRGWWHQCYQCLYRSDHGEIAVEGLHHEVALLEMRSEQLRIHLLSMPARSAESRNVRSVLLAMQLKMRALRQFEYDADKTLGTATLH